MKKDSGKGENGWGLKQTDGGKVGGFFFDVVKESWRGDVDDEDDDDDGEEGSKRGGKNPARVRNHGVDVPPPISAAWCAASAWRDLWDELILGRQLSGKKRKLISVHG